MDKLSIIIPVYNTELYIKRCLDSVVSQTYENIEIICVDDGSTDNSGKICAEYAEKDARIKYIYKPNGGESSARNAGLRNASGHYIGFIDCDDWIAPDMYATLHHMAKKHNAHVNVVNFYKNTDAEQLIMQNRKPIKNGCMSARDMMIYALNRDDYTGYCSYIWNKLFSADLIRKNGLLFDEQIRFGGDVLFHAQVVLSDGCTGVYNDTPLYHYYQRGSSTAHSKDLSTKRDILTAYKRIEQLMNKKGYSDISFWARGFYCYHASVVAEIALQQENKRMFTHMQNEIRIHLDDYIETNKDFPKKHEKIHQLLN